MSRWRRSRDPFGLDEDEVSPNRLEELRQTRAGPATVGAADADEPIPTSTVRGDTPVGQEVRMDRADDRSEVSVVSRGTRIEGTVVAAGSLRVDGEVKGKITAEKDVSLSPQGRVQANIRATSITLAGQVKGDLTAKGDVSLPADSRLDGNIRAQNVQVGGEVKGNIVGDGMVELGTRARVEGDITSRTLAIAEGAVFIGTSNMSEEARRRAQTRGEETTVPTERIAAASTGRPSGS
jgi:cytoskeletal protein CcmA (bactofilin family)